MSSRRGSLIPGLILICLGLILLANRLEWAVLRWIHLYPLLLIAIGIGSAYSIRGHGYRDGVFATVFFLSIGVFFALRNYGFVRYLYFEEVWPIFLIAAGLGFVAIFFFVPSEWRVLIPGSVLLLFGALLLAREYGYLTIYRLSDYWGVILIAIGLSIFLKGFRPGRT